jgi:signal transduction histidine kinase
LIVGLMTRYDIHFRLLALGLAVGLMGAMIVWVTVVSETRVQAGRARLNQLDSESFQIAEQFKDRLREVNDKMRRYASFGESAVWQDFQRSSQEFKQWIRDSAPRLSTGRERALIEQMNSAYETYMQRARDLHVLMDVPGRSGASLAEYNAFSDQSRRLLDLGQNLARAHYESRTQLVVQANETLTQLRFAVFSLVGLLFLFSLALAAVVYRDLIAPLRVKLGESQALAERNEKLASLGVLAAGVAHEVRNPLTAIKTALFIQQKRLAPNSRERGDAELIQREIVRLEKIVNQFLDFGRPPPPELTTVSADRPLREVEELMAPQLAQVGIRLVREESPPISIHIDQAQVKQVLINLVRNAADSIVRDGTISIRARTDRQPLAGAETAVAILEVTDTGRGIPAEVEKRLFDPFFTTKAEGTGLGLPIAARIVALHGGVLQYRTQVNRGSTFSIVLPNYTLPNAGPDHHST